ncbi:MAG TPA: agmatine deiminase family protein, partial [Ilumatobacteraceae bacterium]|nr:agmatine deiminase family protein [Ilumatobacteraceae bacterium]
WAAVTNAIARFEPVTLICDVGDGEVARALVDPAVSIAETPIDESWFRDSGPTFVTDPDGRLGAVLWRFNGWGQQEFCVWDDEQHVGAFAADVAGAVPFNSSMVNEGGGIHVDGEGTVMITRTVQLDPYRNPDLDAGQVEAELKSRLGVDKVLWLERGLTRDYMTFGTRGHVDIVASWVRPGLVVAHSQPDPSHPDHEVCAENLARLRASTDARGRTLEVVEIEAPTVTTFADEIVDWSYINHYVCNGAVILCAFDDPRDAIAADTLARLYPGREVVLVDARPIFVCGGGIHCITQQQPAV